MTAPYFQLLGHVFVAVHSADEHTQLAKALDKAGCGGDRLAQGRDLLKLASTLPERRVEEVGQERIVEHNFHASASEVEMWMQTAAFRLKKAVDADEILQTALGKDLHSLDHSVEVAGRALRMMAMVRAHPALHEQLGTGRSVRDLLMRGNTLLQKFFEDGDDLVSPGAAGDPSAEVFTEIEDAVERMTAWLQSLEKAAAGLSGHPELLGVLGFVPEGVGLPVGGTGYSITLHERSQRQPPDPDAERKPDPGWTIGRQGRNDENLGKGWVEPTFD